MKLVKQSHAIMDTISGLTMLRKIEICGRICYQSYDKMTDDSAKQFVKSIINRGHESVLEHVSITVAFTTDRAIANELVRHRLTSVSQESTRYCSYKDDVEFIDRDWSEGQLCYLQHAEVEYQSLIKSGVSPQIARDVLPHALKTELVVTANLREWRHILKLRTSHYSHTHMVKLMRPLLEEFKSLMPIVFDDLEDK